MIKCYKIMQKGSYCDRKSQLSEKLTEPLNPRDPLIFNDLFSNFPNFPDTFRFYKILETFQFSWITCRRDVPLISRQKLSIVSVGKMTHYFCVTIHGDAIFRTNKEAFIKIEDLIMWSHYLSFNSYNHVYIHIYNICIAALK